MPTQRKHPPYESITARWGGMKIRDELGKKIDEWLSIFDEEDRPLLLELLGYFQYYSESRIKEKVVELYGRFKEEYLPDIDVVAYTKPIKEFGTSFSSILFTSFWHNNNLYDYAEENITGLFSEEIVPTTIAIVDDFSGSGKTFIETIDKILESNPKATKTIFFFLVLFLSEAAEQNINEYADKTGLSIKIIALERVSNAFKPGYIFSEDQAGERQEQYAALYDHFDLKPEYKFGFLNVASLVAFHYNTPNNTLGLFWQDISEFCALFPRHKPEKTELHKMQARTKKLKQSRKTVKIYGIDKDRRSAMMAYCITQKKGFSLEKMKKEFGVTEHQLNKDLKAILGSGYLEYKDSQFFPTTLLKSHIFMNRFKKEKSDSAAVDQHFNLHEEYIPLNFS